MAEGDFSYAACSCRAIRTFRLRRDLPLVAEFFAIRYTIHLHEVPQTAGSLRILARLPWQDLNYAREIMHVGGGAVRELMVTGIEVDCGTLAEVIFLRLVRQGDAEELRGPHVKVPP